MTAAPGRARHHYTYSEYLEYERDSARKHEYDDGDILAMAGGSLRHNAISLRIGAAVHAAVEPGGIAFQSDQRVRVLATGRTTYPDVTLVCGKIELDPADPSRSTLTNPKLLVEVLSPSTEEDDRGEKWQHYQRIPSLAEYVLVSQTTPRIEIYRRLPGGTWEYSVATEGTVRLASGGTIDLATLYADLPP